MKAGIFLISVKPILRNFRGLTRPINTHSDRISVRCAGSSTVEITARSKGGSATVGWAKARSAVPTSASTRTASQPWACFALPTLRSLPIWCGSSGQNDRQWRRVGERDRDGNVGRPARTCRCRALPSQGRRTQPRQAREAGCTGRRRLQRLSRGVSALRRGFSPALSHIRIGYFTGLQRALGAGVATCRIAATSAACRLRVIRDRAVSLEKPVG